jgi:c-di-GMP-binding flagellar brake protein YcgR
MAGFKEQRRCPRIESENIVGYVLYDDKKKKVKQGSGRTRNLSQTGVLLETEAVLKGSYIILVTINLDGNKVKVRGRVVTSRYVESSGCYLTGIEFIGPKDQQIEVIIAFVIAYQHRKHQLGA